MRYVLILLLVASTARADSLSVNVGVGEFAGLHPLAHGGVYAYAGPGYTHDLRKGVTWTTALTLEYAPEFQHLGLFAWSTIDIPLSETVYLNAGVSLIQDEYQFVVRGSAFFLGPCIGVTKNLPHDLFLSPSVGVYYGFSDRTPWAYPMLTFGKTF